jgi:hypothetical protein
MTRRRDWNARNRELGEQAQRLYESHPSPYFFEDQRTCCCVQCGTEVHQGFSYQASTGLRWHGVYGGNPQTRHTVVHRVLQQALLTGALKPCSQGR